jgi:hypothetical protein
MSEADKLKNKLEQAKASAQRPARVTDAEFAVIMLRESFVAAQASFLYVDVFSCGRCHACANPTFQPVLSAAVAALFQKAFAAPPPAAGADPEWFERLKSCAGNSVRSFMKLSGPWDM